MANHWNRYFNGGRLATVSGWLDLLPTAVVRATPGSASHGPGRGSAWAGWRTWTAGRPPGDAAADPGDLRVLRDLAVLRSVHRDKTGDVAAARAAAGRSGQQRHHRGPLSGRESELLPLLAGTLSQREIGRCCTCRSTP
ncbi:hypothetical protein [Pseudonocardia sp. H11422]|uniref:hypothetical protein n=1 Tax=Pseudonocardia sp. H11422 TaxID=2835866 RepID=UPI001BDCCF50|nr:hypothetical protein [Pseudonocardia sp. H11422]